MCDCFFCINDKVHYHGIDWEWERGGRLLVAESLDPKDIQPTRTCLLCGHTEDIK